MRGAGKLVLVLIAAMLAPNLALAGVPPVEDEPLAVTPVPAKDPALPVVHPTLKDARGDVTVTVLTTDVRELAGALQGIPYRGLIGMNAEPGLAAPTLTVPASAIEMIAALPGTLAVSPAEFPQKHRVEDLEADGDRRPGISNINSTINLGALGAWANGFRGQGTSVAIVDDGLDFSHPDLQGTAARVTNASSPYYPLPMAFDPFSMGAFLSTGGTEGTWYVNTSSTDRNVTHTIRVDGRNDFWTDGTELIGSDLRGDTVGPLGEPDWDLVTLYATQDRDFWYFGLNSFANQSDMRFGVFLNTTSSAPFNVGAPSAPAGDFVDTAAGQRPEFAVYLRHYGLQPDPADYEKNETIPAAEVYAWNGLSWGAPVTINDPAVGGALGYSGWSFTDDNAFIEFSLPKAFLGDPASLSVQAVTLGPNASHAQDSAYTDPNFDYATVDLAGTTVSTLTAAVAVGDGFWTHSYTRPDDTVGGQPNTARTWSTIYQYPGIVSKSGTYYFGDHPDENFPLTRILVVDESVSGAYDTVYVDLDHNKDFSNDKPLKRYGKYDPVTRQWFDAASASCPGCPVFDEYSWGDFYDPARGVTAVDWSPGDTRIASGSNDHTIAIWDVASGAKVNELNPHRGRITDVAWSPDGTRLAAAVDDASGNGDFVAVVYETTGWTVFRTLAGHTARVNGLAWSADSQRLATASDDGTARLWTVGTGVFTTLSGHTAAVNAVSWSPLGRVVTASDDASLKVWTSAGTLEATLPYTVPLTAVAITSNESWIASGAADGNVVFWDRATGLFAEAGANNHYFNQVLRVEWSSTGQLASSSRATTKVDTTLVTWVGSSWDTFFPDRSVSAHSDATTGYDVTGLSWDAAGTRLATGGLDKLVKVWAGSPLVETFVYAGHADGSFDPVRYRNGDGIADVSGGILYFLADGTDPIPYSARYASRLGVVNRVPPSGQLAAFFGAFDPGSSHGTLMASSIAGQSVTRFYDPATMDEPSFPQVAGIAPATRLVGIGNVYATTIFDAWFFAVEGYDGAAGTGDEANVVANSFGFSATYQDGWDIYSRFVDYVSYLHGGDRAAFTVSSGNDGNGYGTVTSPASAPNVVTVGASTDFFYRQHADLEGGPSPSYGDVVPFSSRGPTAQGRPDPDVLATGRMSVGATPLNLMTPYNGAIASELWSGTSLASPLAAGVLALVYQAYASRNGGVFPDAAKAKSFIMSGADDISNDVFAQGAGLVNAARATSLAARYDGLAVTPSVWVPGDYQGAKYAAFPSFLSPGESETTTFTVENRNGTAPDNAAVYSGIFQLQQEIRYGFFTQVDLANAPLADWSYFLVTTPLAATLSGPGVYRAGPAGLELMGVIDPDDWLQTDLLRVVFSSNTSTMDPNTDGAFDYRYMIDAYDWTWDGISFPLPDTAAFKDMNRVTINHPDANHAEARVHNPASRTHTGLVAGFRPFGAGAAGLYVSATVQLYRRATWGWIGLSPFPGTLSPGQARTLDATITVPLGTPVGTYEGALYVEGNVHSASWSTTSAMGGEQHFGLPRYNLASASVFRDGVLQLASTYTLYLRSGGLALNTPLNPAEVLRVDYTYNEVSTVPVAVTVPAPSVQFSFGGPASGADELYADHVDMGFGNGGQGGDWHFFYVDVPPVGLFDGTSGVRFLVDAQWERSRTDLNVFAFGPGGSVPSVLGVTFPSSRYGPYVLMTNNGGSEETATFFTTTGGAREIVAPRLVGGLNVIALRQVRLNGSLVRERFSGSVGLMSATPDSLDIVTNQLAGSTSLQVWSSIAWQGIGAVSAGPSAPESLRNVPIKQDNVDGDFIDLLAHGSYTRILRVLPSALIFDVHITSANSARPCPDLDLGVFLDGMGAGNAPNGQAEASEFVAYGADSDADEQVRLIKPTVEDDPDTAENELVTGAPYIVKVLGFTVPYSPTGTFDIDITVVQGSGFSVLGTTSAPQAPYTVSSVGLAWNLPGSTPDGRMLGALYVGPENAPLMLLVPVDLILDRVPPTVAGLSIAARTGFRTDAATGATLNDPRPTLVVTARDPEGRLDVTRLAATLDGEDVSAWVTRPGVSPAARLETTFTFTPPFALTEGGHVFQVTVYDTAGNTADGLVAFNVDTTTPSLALDQPAAFATAAANVTVSGMTDAGATVEVAGTEVPVDAAGGFSRAWPLPEGVHRIDVTATDWFDADATGNRLPGNTLVRTVTVTVDRQVPVITLPGATLGPVSGPAYTAAKHGMVAMSHTINLEECRNGIRSSVLCPNEVATPILMNRPIPETAETMVRMMQPEDLGRVIAFVAAQPPHLCINEIVLSPTHNRGYISTMQAREAAMAGAGRK